MMEYKENTVGWWLSQLKEPLRSRAIEMHGLDFPAVSLLHAVMRRMAWAEITPAFDDGFGTPAFWGGVRDFLAGALPAATDNNDYIDGRMMAEKCAPDPDFPFTGSFVPPMEEPVDSPPPLDFVEERDKSLMFGPERKTEMRKWYDQLSPSTPWPWSKSFPPKAGGVIDPGFVPVEADPRVSALEARVSQLESEFIKLKMMVYRMKGLIQEGNERG